jgi:hypothetical protein
VRAQFLAINDGRLDELLVNAPAIAMLGDIAFRVLEQVQETHGSEALGFVAEKGRDLHVTFAAMAGGYADSLQRGNCGSCGEFVLTPDRFMLATH